MANAVSLRALTAESGFVPRSVQVTFVSNVALGQVSSPSSSVFPVSVTPLMIRKHLHLHHGPPTLLWQRATPVSVGWFAGRTWKNNNKWYI